MTHPRHMTNDELATELENSTPHHMVLPLVDEIIQRLQGKTRACPSENSYQSPEVIDADERRLLDLLEEYGLDSVDALEAEIGRCDGEYCLSDFLDSKDWQNWDAQNRESLHYVDCDRDRRCREAAEHGCDGSTHAEVIDDWRQAVEDSTLGLFTKWKLHAEIDATASWHKQNGSLDQQLG